ncbi:helix-turn-helix domain-containing protein [Nocardioides terrisoli]|uniref:helix-turn-helix domain-containing protein n=1 Tax=Nocardioides terrisoli TaxID=3388267 RepID=UPI00287B6AEC|nr:helix-turn-helix domain-containing protein [Nocardioides marmorisolisilvae]
MPTKKSLSDEAVSGRTSKPEPLAYTLDAVCERLPGTTKRQLQRWIAKGHLKVSKPAGKSGPAFIERAELERFLRAGRNA